MTNNAVHEEETEVDESSVVRSSLETLVEHYSQPIHHQRSSSTLSSSSSPPPRQEREEEEEEKEDWQSEPAISPVALHLLNQLRKCHHPQQCCHDWICGYITHIRPALFTNNEHHRLKRTGIPVLEHYQLILSSLLPWTTPLSSSSSSSLSDNNYYYSTQQQQQRDDKMTTNTMGENLDAVVKRLASDLSLLTESPDGNDDDDKDEQTVLRSTVVMPAILRLMQSCLLLNVNDIKARRSCGVALLLFGQDTDLLTRYFLVDHKLYDITTTTIIRYQTVSVHVGPDWFNFPNNEDFKWTAWWNTANTERVAKSCWNALLQLLLLDKDGDDATNETPVDEEANLLRQKRVVLCALDWIEMATLVRAHFFGRDSSDTTKDATMTTTTTTPPRQQRQYPLPIQSPQDSQAAFQRRQSRIHVALHFILLLNKEHVSPVILQQILPICYALLDSTVPNVIMGAMGLLHVLQCCGLTAEFLHDLDDLLFHVLQRTVQTTRDGTAIFLLSTCVSQYFVVLPHRKKERRQATLQLLTICKKNSFYKNDALLLGILVGGLIPLLEQHAKEPEADAMELGRLGLQSLLPLVEWDGNGRLQSVALVALIQLLLGAYPIMPRHGGKLMCSLLACLGHAQDDDSIIEVATMAAGVVLVICGPRALAILDQVEQQTDEYDSMLVKQTQRIRDQATRLRQK